MEPLKDRAGSDRDAFNLESAAYAIGFEHVRIIHNPTRREILQWVQASKCIRTAVTSHEPVSSVVFVVF